MTFPQLAEYLRTQITNQSGNALSVDEQNKIIENHFKDIHNNAIEDAARVSVKTKGKDKAEQIRYLKKR
jgi:hypothetical protein